MVRAEVVVDDGLTGHGHSTVLRLAWCREDPLAVSLVLTGEPDHPALPRGEWVVLRDFLRYGMEEPTGDGAVRVCPDGDLATPQVLLELWRGERPYRVKIDAATLDDFLAQTECIVPAGEEASDETLDALIERLLER